MHEATIEALSANGLIITQLPTDLDGRFALKTVLAHVSGGSIETTLPMPPVKNDPHGIGGAISYSRRYMYAAILNIVGEEDDDGELAMGNPNKKLLSTYIADDLKDSIEKQDSAKIKECFEWYQLMQPENLLLCREVRDQLSVEQHDFVKAVLAEQKTTKVTKIVKSVVTNKEQTNANS